MRVRRSIARAKVEADVKRDEVVRGGTTLFDVHEGGDGVAGAKALALLTYFKVVARRRNYTRLKARRNGQKS